MYFGTYYILEHLCGIYLMGLILRGSEASIGRCNQIRKMNQAEVETPLTETCLTVYEMLIRMCLPANRNINSTGLNDRNIYLYLFI